MAEAIGGSITAASDLRESMSLSEQVFEGNARKVQAWGKTAADAFGMSQREALNFASTFGTAFKNVGMSLDDTTQKSETLTRLAADLGSAFNTSSDEAAVALRSGLLGESEPLRKFGVFLDEAKVKAKALAMGLKPVGGALSDIQKVAARYALIMEQTADSQGMFGRDSESLADAQKSLGAAMENLGAAIGKAFTPAATDAVNVLTDLVKSLETVEDPVRKNQNAFERLTSDIGEMVDNLFDLISFWDGYTAAGEDRKNQILAEAAAAEAAAEAYARTNVEARAEWAAGQRARAETNKQLADTAEGLAAIEKEAKDAAQRLKDFEKSLEDAADAMIEAKFAPKELALELKGATLEQTLLSREIAKFKRDHPHPTKEQQRDLVALQEQLLAAQRRIQETRLEIRKLDGMSLADLRQTFIDSGLGAAYLARKIKDALDYARLLDEIEISLSGAGGRGKQLALASGGPAMPGMTYTVGERGPETLVMGRAGGYVIPNSGGGWAPVSLAVNLDGRTIATVVDRHLYYKAARAPQSPYSG
jgi:uncharacterized protein (DUF2164 family)